MYGRAGRNRQLGERLLEHKLVRGCTNSDGDRDYDGNRYCYGYLQCHRDCVPDSWNHDTYRDCESYSKCGADWYPNARSHRHADTGHPDTGVITKPAGDRNAPGDSNAAADGDPAAYCHARAH
jgi:hypothetical protein